MTEARLWDPERLLDSAQQVAAAPGGFTSARQLEQSAPAEPSFKLALGEVMDLAGFSFQPADPSGGGSGGGLPAKKPHARAGQQLLRRLRSCWLTAGELTTEPCLYAAGPRVAAYLVRVAEAEAEEKAASAGSVMRQPAVKPSQAPAKPAPKRPALPGVPKSAAPAAKRKAAPAGAAAKPKAPAAPKKAKAAAAAGTAAGAPHAAVGAPGGAAPPGAAGEPGSAAAPAAPAAPARARAKPADVDVADVTARVQALHAAGTGLAGLTIPQLKAFLKSVGKAVGGNKAALEERARLHLSSEQ